MVKTEGEGTLLNIAVKEFIPRKIYELLDNPENLRIIKLDAGDKNHGFLIYEADSTKVLTDENDWQKWSSSGKWSYLPTPNLRINKLHAIYKQLIYEGTLQLTDRILLACTFHLSEQSPEVLEVAEFNGEENAGIGTDFYTNCLPRIASLLGVRFITGINNSDNIDFFVGKLGRVRMTDIKPEYRRFFAPQMAQNSSVMRFRTIQFLYPEDKAKYCLEEVNYLV